MKCYSHISTAFMLSSLLLLSSCGHIFTKSHSYQKSETVEINGAIVSGAVKPAGGESGFGYRL